MPCGYPRRTDQKAASVGVSGIAPTTVTSGGSANTKGSWVAISTSTPYDCFGLQLYFSHTSTTTRDRLIDIGFGGAGSEVVIFADYQVPNSGSTTVQPLELPIAIPAGTRISVRFQASGAASQSLRVWGKLLPGPRETCASFTTYGAMTADSGGTGVDPGGTANTFPAYTSLTGGATTEAYSKLLIVLSWRANGTPTADSHFNLKFALNSPSVPVIEDEIWHMPSAGSTGGPNPHGWFDVNIPVGSLLSVTVACSTNDATDRLCDVILYLGTYGRPA